jgi:hypothetical protein
VESVNQFYIRNGRMYEWIATIFIISFDSPAVALYRIMPSLLKVLRSLTTAGPIINLGYASYQGFIPMKILLTLSSEGHGSRDRLLPWNTVCGAPSGSVALAASPTTTECECRHSGRLDATRLPSSEHIESPLYDCYFW